MDEKTADEIVKVFSELLARGRRYRRTSRKELAQLIARHCRLDGYKDQAELWEQAGSDQSLKKWFMKKGSVPEAELSRFLKQAGQIPGMVRQGLFKVARELTPLAGGKPRALTLDQTLHARRREKELIDKGMSKRKAWKQIAKEMSATYHTIRRACDEREAERSHYSISAVLGVTGKEN